MKIGDSTRVGNWFQTYSGVEYYIEDAREDEIFIEDIAHALSQMCRFNGHCRTFHSVAAHSILVSQVCNPENALWGLLHDASEAYTGDMVRPLKEGMDKFKAVEQALMRVICKKFGLPPEMPTDVILADNIVLATERRDIMSTSPRPWSIDYMEGVVPLEEKLTLLQPSEAKILFLERFCALTGE